MDFENGPIGSEELPLKFSSGSAFGVNAFTERNHPFGADALREKIRSFRNDFEEKICTQCYRTKMLGEIELLKLQLQMKTVENERDREKAHAEELTRLVQLYSNLLTKKEITQEKEKE